MSLQPARYEFAAFAARHGLGHRLAATRVVTTANKLANGRYQAVSYHAGCLHIAVSGPEARLLLQGDLASIRTTLNEQLGAEVVQTIKFRQERIEY